ncbi:MAG: endonuclease/exonuclease/phosphatase family protein [Crocinitomicaceae bacterium]
MKFTCILLAIFAFTSGFTQTKSNVLFYNVENLFDTIDSPNVDDAEFLPSSKKSWNTAKYQEKISHINQVMDEFSSIALMGMCEIENKTVVEDVVKGQKKPFKIVHFDSQDARGIDVALLYNPSIFKLKKKGYLRFTLKVNEESKATRDILYVQLKNGKSNVYVLVNHWPSRSGGEKETEANRILAAQTAKNFIDEILAKDANAKIIFMGDLNDYPSNQSVQLIDEKLDPMILKSSGSMGGSYSYKNEWDVLDHILVSPGLKNNKGIQVVDGSGKINEFPFLLTTYKDNIVPFRTFARDDYLKGYSDHLPVSIEITF